MKKACLVVNGYLQKDNIFNPILQRDYIFDRFIKLKVAFKERGYELSTDDIHSIDESDVVIYASNMPKKLPKLNNIEKSYLILSESPFIRPDNYDIKKHIFFNKVFTWSDDLVDGVKYIKLNYAHAFPETINKSLSIKRKLCVLIAGNKKPKYVLDSKILKLDLYLEREKSIRWFEKNHLQDFDLYGVGWDKFFFTGSKLVRALNRIPLLPDFFLKISGRSYPSYKGTVEHKKPIMEKYRFSICYENARDIPGYITEKIFDSFFAGCVPVYWGANNITDFIPKNCFIDKRNFSNYEKLHAFLKSMTDEEYRIYLDNIESYLNSTQAIPYRSEGFVQTVIETIFKTQGKK
jgi:alpha(1,3/1,4) fucosyltransferase